MNRDASTWLLPSDLIRNTRRPRTAQWTSHTANKFSPATLCAACKNRVYETLQASFHLSQSRLQASTKWTNVRNTRPFSNGTPPSQLRTNWIRTERQTHTNFLPKFRWISRRTPGIIKKPEFLRKWEYSHPWEKAKCSQSHRLVNLMVRRSHQEREVRYHFPLSPLKSCLDSWQTLFFMWFPHPFPFSQKILKKKIFAKFISLLPWGKVTATDLRKVATYAI